MRYSRAFSAFELLCIIVIFAILSSIGVRYIGNMKERSCILHLKSQLAHTQKRLSEYYSHTFLEATPIQPQIARSIIASLPHSAVCGFDMSNNHLVAHIGSNKLSFQIEPTNLEYNPRIFCNLRDELCKQMSDRILEK